MDALTDRAKGVFLDALDIDSPDDRRAFLDRACGRDAPLRAEVDGLLAHHPKVGSFLASRPADPDSTAGMDATPVPAGAPDPDGGTVIGPYRLLERIGEGGFGLVYAAEQSEPVRRRVALKVLKPGMGTREVVARFEAERQALARMDHPHIARIFDAGATPAGRPYFVMELVDGVPITRYCDARRLPVRDRLGLFADLCGAVQHAHQKGVIHRDLKPSNVLVADRDGRPAATVIDFGIAKAVGPPLTDEPVYTRAAQMIGTPLYMSPEQAGGGGADVDTRADIYALGVVLYELLTGTTPVDQGQLTGVGYDELRRIIREDEPARPSGRLAAPGPAAATAAAARGTEPRKLSALLRGEIDWIVMKALEKDRGRRYESAGAFAADVRRYLADEPVLACPPTAGYRLRKFARRNQRGLATAGLVAACVLALGGGAGWVLLDRSGRRAVTAEQVSQALAESDALYRRGRLPEALAAAREAQARLEQGGGGEGLRDRVRGRLSDLAMAGRLEDARLGLATADVNPESAARHTAAAYAEAFRDYGIDLAALDQAEAAARVRGRDIRNHLTAALDHWASLPVVTTDERRRLTLVAAAADDGDAWRGRVRAAAAGDVPALKRLAASPEAVAQPPSTLILLARHLRTCGEVETAAELMRRAHRRHPGDFWVNIELADLAGLAVPPRPADVVRYLTAAVAVRPDSPGAHLRAALALVGRGPADEARAYYEESVRLKPDYFDAHYQFGVRLYTDAHDPAGAVAALTRAIELDPTRAVCWSIRASAHSQLGRHDEALAGYTRVIVLHPTKATGWSSRGTTYLTMGRSTEAVADLTKAIELDDRDVTAWRMRARAYFALGQVEKADADAARVTELLGGR